MFSMAEHLVEEIFVMSWEIDGRESGVTLKHDSMMFRRPGETLQFTSNCKYSAVRIFNKVSFQGSCHHFIIHIFSQH